MTAATLLRHEASIAEAITTHDQAMLARLAHPSFTYLGSHANQTVRWNRSEWFKSILSLQTNAFTHTTTDVTIAERVHAVVTVEAPWLGIIKGASVQHTLLISDFWLKSSGVWRLLRRHASVSPQAAHHVPMDASTVLI